MSKPFKTALSWTIPTIFVLIYALYPYLPLPRPYYAPKLRQILWHKPEGVITQGWYGRTLMACVIAILLGALMAWIISRRPMTGLSRFAPWIVTVAAVVAMIITMVYEIHRWM